MRALLLLLLMTPVCAADVQVTARPPLPLPNLVQNPGLEQIGPQGPAHWSFGTANPENFVTGVAPTGHNGPSSLHLLAHTGIMSGYWNQTLLPLKPDTDYVARIWYRLGDGKLLLYAHGGSAGGPGLDQRFYDASMRRHFLVPVFLKPEYMKGGDPNQWRLCRLPAVCLLPRLPGPHYHTSREPAGI